MPVTALREIKILKALMNNSHRNRGHGGTHFSVLNGKSGLRSGGKSGEEGGAGGSSIIEILDMIVVPSSSEYVGPFILYNDFGFIFVNMCFGLDALC